MKPRILLLSIMFLITLSSTGILAEDTSEANLVLMNYFNTIGGLEKITAIQSLSAKLQIEIYDYEYNIKMHGDGRFRIEREHQVSIFDGKQYWQSFHGLVGMIPQDDIDDYKITRINAFFFHDLIGSEGNPVSLDLIGTIQQHGKTYTVLSGNVETGKKREYYFNKATGLIEKIIEYEDDKEFGQKKNIYRFKDHVEISGIKLFTRTESICITTNETLTPPLHISDISVNGAMDEKLFTKPEDSAPKSTIENGVITGQVLGFSKAGSLITNITRPQLDTIGLKDSGLYKVEVNKKFTTHKYIENIRAAEGIGSGDYILLFNSTPALWVVKAYVGMKNDLTVAKGDIVKISRGEKGKAVEKEGANKDE